MCKNQIVYNKSMHFPFFHKRDAIVYADDDDVSILNLIRLRFPPLGLGLLLGILLSIVASRFEEVLAIDVRVAFFIPFIVYMADAVGTQTQTIYSRDLRSGKASFKKYLYKESVLGLLLGLLSGCMSAVVTMLWFNSTQLATSVSIAMFTSIALAPVVALLVTEVLQLEHKDPAVGAGPIATVIQDTLSVLIYGVVASLVFF